MCKLFDVRFHLVRAERTVQSDNERLRVCDRSQKRFYCLPAQHAPGTMGHGGGNHHRLFFVFEKFGDSEPRSFGVERVEDRLDNQKIDISYDECADLIEVGLTQLIECDRAKSGIIYVR